MKSSKKSNPIKKTTVKIFARLFVFIILIAAAFLLVNPSNLLGTGSDKFDGTKNYVEESWVYKKGDKVLDPKLTVPAFFEMEKGVTYSISTYLTYDGSEDTSPTCFFFVDHMFCRVTVGGEEVFSYLPKDIHKPDRSKSPGNVYVSADLPKDCMGKELVIEFIPSLDKSIEYQLPNPSFGDYASQLSSIFWDELAHNIIAILTICLGLGCIFYAILALTESSLREGVFIGIFAILFGLYNVTESDFDFYMISNPYFTYVLDYITFTLIPIFLLAFLRERMDRLQRRISSVIIIMDVGMFITETVLHFTGVMDMREFLPILHVVYFAEIIINLILIATTKKNKWKKPLIFQMIPIIIGMLIDVMVYYMHWDLGSSDATFTAIGVIIFLVSELFYVWKYSIEVYTESTRSQIYQQMAFIDSLTGIGNRRAFELEKDDIENKRKTFESLTVISADINNLKATNDMLGHASGDFLIRSAANVLTNLATSGGEVFRIGGDEFLVFLYEVSKTDLESRLEQLRKNIDAINATSSVKLELAVGVEENCSNVNEAIESADRKMYIDKEKSKAAELKENR